MRPLILQHDLLSQTRTTDGIANAQAPGVYDPFGGMHVA
jgi:hypothetical protein